MNALGTTITISQPLTFCTKPRDNQTVCLG